MRTALVVLVASLAMVVGRLWLDRSAADGQLRHRPRVEADLAPKPRDRRMTSNARVSTPKVGKEFECHFTGPEGKDYTAHMKVTKVEGDDVQFYIKTEPSK